MERKIIINELGDTITIKVEKISEVHTITVDGVVWVETSNYLHATVLFNMMAEHLTEYMNYEKN